MNREILNKDQRILLNVVKHFSSKGFYLVGETALALQTRNRESIDFDLFSLSKFENQE